MIRQVLAFSVIVFVGVGGAAAQSSLVRTRQMPPTYSETASEGQLRAFEARVDTPASEALALISNQTRLISPPGAPLQVAFADASGAIHLWFPQTGELRRGRWHIEERVRELLQGGRPIKTSRQATVCFNYSGAVPNIFAPEHMRNTQCAPVSFIQRHLLDSKPGDIFGLARGVSPGALGSVQTRKLDEIARRTRG